MRERIYDEDLWTLNSERNEELAEVGILQTSPGTIAKFETDYYDSPSSESLTLDLVFIPLSVAAYPAQILQLYVDEAA